MRYRCQDKYLARHIVLIDHEFSSDFHGSLANAAVTREGEVTMKKRLCEVTRPRGIPIDICPMRTISRVTR